MQYMIKMNQLTFFKRVVVLKMCIVDIIDCCRRDTKSW